MYLGQAEICQNDLDIFMRSAELFKVKGLYREKKSEMLYENTLDDVSMNNQAKLEQHNHIGESFI